MMSLLTELDAFCNLNLQRCQPYGLEKSVSIGVHPWLKVQMPVAPIVHRRRGFSGQSIGFTGHIPGCFGCYRACKPLPPSKKPQIPRKTARSLHFPMLRSQVATLPNRFAILQGHSAILQNHFAILQSRPAMLRSHFAGLRSRLPAFLTIRQYCGVIWQYCKTVRQCCEVTLQYCKTIPQYCEITAQCCKTIWQYCGMIRWVWKTGRKG